MNFRRTIMIVFAVVGLGEHIDAPVHTQLFRLRKGLPVAARIDGEGGAAYMWITEKIKEMAERIYGSEREKVFDNISAAPRHLS